MAREKILQFFVYLNLFRVYELRILRVLAVFRGSGLADTSGFAVIRGSILVVLWILRVCVFFQAVCIAGIASTGSTSSVGTARMASTGVITLNMRSILGV